MTSLGPPPVKTGSPVSPRKPCSRLSPSAPAIQTIGFEPPSVVVTIADPRPSTDPHHAEEIIGDCSAWILSTISPGFEIAAGPDPPKPPKCPTRPPASHRTARRANL